MPADDRLEGAGIDGAEDLRDQAEKAEVGGILRVLQPRGVWARDQTPTPGQLGIAMPCTATLACGFPSCDELGHSETRSPGVRRVPEAPTTSRNCRELTQIPKSPIVPILAAHTLRDPRHSHLLQFLFYHTVMKLVACWPLWQEARQEI